MMIFAYPKPLLENFLELFILYPMIFCGLLWQEFIIIV